MAWRTIGHVQCCPFAFSTSFSFRYLLFLLGLFIVLFIVRTTTKKTSAHANLGSTDDLIFVVFDSEKHRFPPQPPLAVATLFEALPQRGATGLAGSDLLEALAQPLAPVLPVPATTTRGAAVVSVLLRLLELVTCRKQREV